MRQNNLYEISEVTSKNHSRRCVVFLISNDRRVTAKDKFDKFKRKIELNFRTRFDAWVDGQINTKKFHGWNKSEFSGHYTNCFVFKYEENNKQIRLYGFLSHPKASDRRYEVCVLAVHAFKNQHETHETDLKTIEQLRTLSDIQKIVEDFFKEKKDGSSLDRTKH